MRGSGNANRAQLQRQVEPGSQHRHARRKAAQGQQSQLPLAAHYASQVVRRKTGYPPPTMQSPCDDGLAGTLLPPDSQFAFLQQPLITAFQPGEVRLGVEDRSLKQRRVQGVAAFLRLSYR